MLCAMACGGARPMPHEERGAESSESAEVVPHAIRVRILFVALTGRTAHEAEERARMLARAARSDDFSDLAAHYGDGENPRNMGSSGLVLEPGDSDVPEPVVRAAFALARWQISEPIRTDAGYWVLQRVE